MTSLLLNTGAENVFCLSSANFRPAADELQTKRGQKGTDTTKYDSALQAYVTNLWSIIIKYSKKAYHIHD